MSTFELNTIEKEFDSMYATPPMRLLMEEEGWVYKGTKDEKPTFQYIW